MSEWAIRSKILVKKTKILFFCMLYIRFLFIKKWANEQITHFFERITHSLIISQKTRVSLGKPMSKFPPCSQGNQSKNFNKEKRKAAGVISYFPFLKWMDWFPERHFDRILVANTETWLPIRWHKNFYHNEMPTKIQSPLRWSI